MNLGQSKEGGEEGARGAEDPFPEGFLEKKRTLVITLCVFSAEKLGRGWWDALWEHLGWGSRMASMRRCVIAGPVRWELKGGNAIFVELELDQDASVRGRTRLAYVV